jgi:hypothetical protein
MGSRREPEILNSRFWGVIPRVYIVLKRYKKYTIWSRG